MPRPPSPAQRAVQVTFLLKGHLKNARIAYIRAAVLLARVRAEISLSKPQAFFTLVPNFVTAGAVNVTGERSESWPRR
jgi:hypothetical protein